MKKGTAHIREHTRETEILEKAIHVFRQTTGLNLVREGNAVMTPQGQRVDAMVRLVTPDINKQFAVEVKRLLNPNNLGLAAEQMARLPEQGLMVAEYVNPNMAERLKQMNVLFLDTVGNTYLNIPPIFIYTKGQKPPAKTHQERPTRAFDQAGLKVIFAMLCMPELVNAPYRTIAGTTDVALGTVGWVLYDLKEQGHLLKMGQRGRRLVQKQRLLERWVTAYPERLRPKLMLGKYAAPNKNWWEQAQIKPLQAYWGAEIAAARLTQYLKPEIATIYVRGLPAKLLATYQLRTDPTGNVEVLKAFWDPACDWTDQEIVHPLLVYADLLATGDPRNLETAKRVYDDQVARFVRED